ncbi:unnamed protein product, partial [Urochloa humidicola]
AAIHLLSPGENPKRKCERTAIQKRKKRREKKKRAIAAPPAGGDVAAIGREDEEAKAPEGGRVVPRLAGAAGATWSRRRRHRRWPHHRRTASSPRSTMTSPMPRGVPRAAATAGRKDEEPEPRHNVSSSSAPRQCCVAAVGYDYIKDEHRSDDLNRAAKP